MDNKEIDPIVKEAIKAYGKEKQLHQTTEECGELIVAISHYLRNRPNSDEDVAEEIADVKLMVRQVELMLGIESDVESYMNVKLRRLKFKLEGEKIDESR